MNINIGDTIDLQEQQTHTRFIQSNFYNEWKPLMDDNTNEWTILEMDSSDIAKATNRFTTRATRLNGYDYTDGYEFRCVRRSPYSYFLGRKS
tara:strand:- start:877 stop:1152 length:276 start_codon:yes stop_codon:yes gene_type:complete